MQCACFAFWSWALLVIAALSVGCVPNAKLHKAVDAAVDAAEQTGPTDAGHKGMRSGPGAVVDGGRPKDDGLGDYTGLWTGVTSQGRLVSFQVFGNALTRFRLDFEVQADAIVNGQPALCTARSEVQTTIGMPREIGADHNFRIGPFSSNPTGYTAMGEFLSSSRASGSIELSYSGDNCHTGNILLTWNATHVVCGNGRLEWPETCDDGSKTDPSRCTEVCQLIPRTEAEPNDLPSAANGPIVDSTIYAASLASGSDVDVFALKNPYPGALAVQLETHGESVGVCAANGRSVDTLISLLDESGELLADDDEGSRQWHCSSLLYSMSGGQTIYVRVTSKNGASVPRYHLSVAYQNR